LDQSKFEGSFASVIKRESEKSKMQELHVQNVDEDAKDAMNPFGSRSWGPEAAWHAARASVNLGLSTIKSSHDVEHSSEQRLL
jgi:hypothetical protein